MEPYEKSVDGILAKSSHSDSPDTQNQFNAPKRETIDLSGAPLLEVAAQTWFGCITKERAGKLWDEVIACCRKFN